MPSGRYHVITYPPLDPSRAGAIIALYVFPIGKTYTAMIAPARDGSNGGYVMTWTLPDGTKMDFWHDYGDGSTEK